MPCFFGFLLFVRVTSVACGCGLFTFIMLHLFCHQGTFGWFYVEALRNSAMLNLLKYVSKSFCGIGLVSQSMQTFKLHPENVKMFPKMTEPNNKQHM